MQACEEALLHTDFSRDPPALERMLTADFEEISSSGRLSDRQAVAQWLLHKDPAARWHLQELAVTELTPVLRLVRYHAKQILPVASAGSGALHSSLWRFSASAQCWQLQFHQATKLS
jgi:hypothetical protein